MAKSSQSRATRSTRRTKSEPAPDPRATQGLPPQAPFASNGPSPEAVDLFEQATRSLQRHNYRAALKLFKELVQQFPSERALLDRARVYATLCERELQRGTSHPPETTQERLTAATAALNNGDDAEAERLVVLALNQAPEHELAFYLLAVVHARRGSMTAALAALRRAMTISPEVRAQAAHDADFEPLRGNDAFEQLLADPLAQSGTRRRPRPSAG